MGSFASCHCTALTWFRFSQALMFVITFQDLIIKCNLEGVDDSSCVLLGFFTIIFKTWMVHACASDCICLIVAFEFGRLAFRCASSCSTSVRARSSLVSFTYRIL